MNELGYNLYHSIIFSIVFACCSFANAAETVDLEEALISKVQEMLIGSYEDSEGGLYTISPRTFIMNSGGHPESITVPDPSLLEVLRLQPGNDHPEGHQRFDIEVFTEPQPVSYAMNTPQRGYSQEINYTLTPHGAFKEIIEVSPYRVQKVVYTVEAELSEDGYLVYRRKRTYFRRQFYITGPWVLDLTSYDGRINTLDSEIFLSKVSPEIFSLEDFAEYNRNHVPQPRIRPTVETDADNLEQVINNGDYEVIYDQPVQLPPSSNTEFAPQGNTPMREVVYLDASDISDPKPQREAQAQEAEVLNISDFRSNENCSNLLKD